MKYVLIGANNPHTIRVFTELQTLTPNAKLIGFLDNDPLKIGTYFYDYPIIGGTDIVHTLSKDYQYVNLITRDCLTRFNVSKEVYEQGGEFTNFVHPSVCLNMVVD